MTEQPKPSLAGEEVSLAQDGLSCLFQLAHFYCCSFYLYELI